MKDIYLRHRFIGHVSLIENKLGMKTLFDPNFRKELECLLGLDKKRIVDCPIPNTIIMNSGLHDSRGTRKDSSRFEHYIKLFIENLNHKYERYGYKVPRLIWKGNREESLDEFNDIAASVMKKFEIPFVNITDIEQYAPRYSQGSIRYSSDKIHFGSFARKHDMRNFGTISMLITQTVLQELCKNEFLKNVEKEQFRKENDSNREANNDNDGNKGKDEDKDKDKKSDKELRKEQEESKRQEEKDLQELKEWRDDMLQKKAEEEKARAKKFGSKAKE